MNLNGGGGGYSLVPRLTFIKWKNSLVNCLYHFAPNILKSLDITSTGYEFKNALVNSECKDSLLVLLSKGKIEWPWLDVVANVGWSVSILLVDCWHKMWDVIYNDKVSNRKEQCSSVLGHFNINGICWQLNRAIYLVVMVGVALRPSSVSVRQTAQSNYPVAGNWVIWRHDDNERAHAKVVCDAAYPMLLGPGSVCVGSACDTVCRLVCEH